MRIHNIATALVYVITAIAKANWLDIVVPPDQPYTNTVADGILRIAFVGSAILAVAAVIAFYSVRWARVVSLLGLALSAPCFGLMAVQCFMTLTAQRGMQTPVPRIVAAGGVVRRVAVFRARCVGMGALC
jgi:hypothetical protein